MKKRMGRLTGALLAAALILTLPSAALAGGDRPLTRGEARDMLLAAADDYAGLSAGELLRGDDTGELHLDRPLSRAEALVLLERAFGGFDEPKGANAYNAFPAESFTDVPEWARTELAQTLRAGIVAGTGEGRLSPERQVTAGELETLIRRAYAYKGTNLKDDYYAAVNKPQLDAVELPQGIVCRDAITDISYQVEGQVLDMLPEIAGRPNTTGAEGRISALYRTAIDLESRNGAGVEPIRGFLEGIDAAGTVEEVLEAELEIERETETGLLLGFGLEVDMADSERYALTFSAGQVSMPKDFYLSGEEGITLRYLDYLTELLVLAGAEEETAWAQAERAYALEWELAEASLDLEDHSDVEKTYNLYTFSQLRELFPPKILEGAFANTGFRKEGKIRVEDVGAMEAFAARLEEGYLDSWKALLKLSLLRAAGSYLNQEFYEAEERFTMEYYGGGEIEPDVLWGAAGKTGGLLGDDLARLYGEEHVSPQLRADVEEMVGEILSVYRDRIRDLDWMGETTKAMAIRKLDAMVVKVGCPERWDTYLDRAEIRSPEEGGTFYDNAMAVQRAWGDYTAELQGTRVDRDRWNMYTYDANACYDPACNDITFPAAILQAPIYDPEASREENLGRIGYIIAHEITHAFDDYGARFDERGNAADWWTAEDYAAFRQRCQAVVDWYDGQEWAPGFRCNGERTLGENVADLGAAACIVEVAGRWGDADYDALFRAMAGLWSGAAYRSYQQYVQDSDTHADGKLRVNRVLQTLPQFYETYGIREGDGMWVPPEDRVSIW